MQSSRDLLIHNGDWKLPRCRVVEVDSWRAGSWGVERFPKPGSLKDDSCWTWGGRKRRMSHFIENLLPGTTGRLEVASFPSKPVGP